MKIKWAETDQIRRVQENPEFQLDPESIPDRFPTCFIHFSALWCLLYKGIQKPKMDKWGTLFKSLLHITFTLSTSEETTPLKYKILIRQ